MSLALFALAILCYVAAVGGIVIHHALLSGPLFIAGFVIWLIAVFVRRSSRAFR
jgi:hypothetical protein